MPDVASVYCDGGVIVRNPSVHGGTWAWLTLDADGRELAHDAGVVTPADLDVATTDKGGELAVTNNQTELLAAVLALEELPDRWEGTIYTDSSCTRLRLTCGKGFAGIPDGLRERCLAERARLGDYRVVLLAGHPTKADLFRGFKRKKGGAAGLPVSKWNKLCDEWCRALARRRVQRLGAAGLA